MRRCPIWSPMDALLWPACPHHMLVARSYVPLLRKCFQMYEELERETKQVTRVAKQGAAAAVHTTGAGRPLRQERLHIPTGCSRGQHATCVPTQTSQSGTQWSACLSGVQGSLHSLRCTPLICGARQTTETNQGAVAVLRTTETGCTHAFAAHMDSTHHQYPQHTPPLSPANAPVSPA